jgi:hypothetical protein
MRVTVVMFETSGPTYSVFVYIPLYLALHVIVIMILMIRKKQYETKYFKELSQHLHGGTE